MPDPNAKPLPQEEEQLDPQEQIEVPEEEAPVAGQTLDLDEEDANEAALKTLDNKAFAAMRKEASEAKKERDALKARIADYEKRAAQPVQYAPPPAPVSTNREMIGGVPVPQTKQEWDALARHDWQTAVDMRSIIAARKVQEDVRRVDTSTRVLEDSKQRVLSRHPELNDTNTEKSQIYLSILDKNPEYLTMSKGPVLAMRDMEEEMEARGYTREQIFDSKKVIARNEAARVNRGALTGGGRMPEKQGRTVQLSKDDLEFCKTQGLDPKDYARERLALENNRKGAQL
jgi:hypothetical protein